MGISLSRQPETFVGSDRDTSEATRPTSGYVINSDVAKIFLRFFDYQMAQYNPKRLYTFDAHLQWWAMGQGAEAYIPLRHYGEHGGNPQPEHRIFGVRLVGERRGGVHRADNLQGPLAFLPQYANGKRISFISQRTIARGYGWARLLCGRWISDVYSRSRWDTMKMHAIGLRRCFPGANLNLSLEGIWRVAPKS